MMSSSSSSVIASTDLATKVPTTATSVDFRAEPSSGPATIDCVPFINSWMAPLPSAQGTVISDTTSTVKLDPLTMPVNQAALEAVYGTSGTGASTNPYYNAIGYNNSAYAPYNPQHYYQMAMATPLTNYLNTAAAAAASVNSAAYYPPYSTSGFDSYSTNQYYNSGRAAAATANNYYNATSATLPYMAALGTDTLATSTPSLTGAQISPYTAIGSGQKVEHKPPRRTKKKKPTGGLASPEPSYARVFVYELEDLCSFLQTNYFQNIYVLLDSIIRNAFELHHIDECDQANVEDANVDDISEMAYNNNNNQNGDTEALDEKPDIIGTGSPGGNGMNRGAVDGLRQMARRYQRMKDVYNKCKDNIGELVTYLPGISVETITSLFKEQNSFLESYRRCLRIATERSTEMERFTNVVVSTEPLASTMAKLLLFNLAAYVPVENIYSSHKIGKTDILDRASLRFKKNMLIASSNSDTRDIAKKERIPVWPIRNPRDIETYYIALDKVLIGS